MNIMVESEMGGQKLPLAYVIRAANHKTVQQIHSEIRAAQAHTAQLAQEWKRMQWYVMLPTFILFMAPASVRNNPRVGLYGDFSWVFVLDEKVAGVTRLIVRTRASYGPRLFRMLTLPLLYPGDFVMARMMLRTIKQRVEQSVGTGLGKAERQEPVALTTEVSE